MKRLNKNKLTDNMDKQGKCKRLHKLPSNPWKHWHQYRFDDTIEYGRIRV